MSIGATPSQTIGPFFGPALVRPGVATMIGPATRGERLIIEGRVLDGEGAAVADAMIEIWQANAEGRYDHPADTQEKLIDPHFHGFGRTATDGAGRYRFETIRPGRVPGDGATLQAPHIVVAIFARGLLRGLSTRIYFPDERSNARDPVLNSVPSARRGTLIASAEADGILHFDIVLQGEGETVFFEI